MNQNTQKNILLCVAGMTPQIVTETLCALIRRSECVDEIRVITTLAGRDKVVTELLHPQAGKFFAFCREHGIDPATINFSEKTISLLRLRDGLQLEDIRSAADNECAADQICEFVRQITCDPQTRLHASVAGGRKTMGIYLTTALQLYGRTWDTLSHVLVSENFETNRDFYYLPPTPRTLSIRDRVTGEIKQLSTANAEIHLAEIPFIRLRGMLSNWLGDQSTSYRELVQRAQSDLDLLETSHDLRLNLRERTVSVANRKVRLAEREFFIYLLFARLRRESNANGATNPDGWQTLSQINRAQLDQTFRLITAAREQELGLEECASYPRYDFLVNLAARLASQHQLDQEDLRRTFSETRARINRKLEEAGFPARFLLASQGERGALRYGLNIAPDRIAWQ